MNKLLAIAVFITSVGVNAQDIPNPGFEEWTEEGGPFSGYLDPADWTTLNSQTAILGITPATRASGADAYAGDYALRLETNFIGLVNQMAPGLCILGEINTDTQSVEGGIPINDRPNALTGWFKYLPNGIDTGEVRMTLTRWNELEGTRDTIGVGTYYPTGTTDDYTFFSAPVVYDSELVPDTMQVILVSGSQFVAEEGSAIYFDELVLEYTPTGLESQSKSSVSVFPNPAVNTINFNIIDVQRIRAFDLYGRELKVWNLQPGQQQIMLDGMAQGQYLLQFTNSSDETIGATRVLVMP